MHSVARYNTAANDASSAIRPSFRAASIRALTVVPDLPPRAPRPYQTRSPIRLPSIDLSSLDPAICPTRSVKRGESLYRVGDPFQCIYTIRAGHFKTVISHRDGTDQITGFQITGDSLGLDGVCLGHQICDAVALEDSVVCIIRFSLLETLSRDVNSLQQHLHKMLSGEIVRKSDLALLLGTMTAEQRVAAFLLDLSDRLHAKGYSPNQLVFRMTREELGSYLGIKLETVSRMLSKLDRQKLIVARGKHIHILDRAGLSAI